MSLYTFMDKDEFDPNIGLSFNDIKKLKKKQPDNFDPIFYVDMNTDIWK